MEKALELMPSGIVCVWTHKAILPEVVSIMHGLGRVTLVDVVQHPCVHVKTTPFAHSYPCCFHL